MAFARRYCIRGEFTPPTGVGKPVYGEAACTTFSQYQHGRHLRRQMRDRRTGEIKRIDPNLFVKLNQLQQRLGLRNAEVVVIIGYRSAKPNAKLKREHHGVASNSFHIRGQAVDIQFSGVPLVKVKQAAESLSNGGVGYYPRSNFVHVDTGPVRTWLGV